MNARTASEPSLSKLISELKAAGYVVTRSGCLNNASAYKIDSKPGLFTKKGLLVLAATALNPPHPPASAGGH